MTAIEHYEWKRGGCPIETGPKARQTRIRGSIDIVFQENDRLIRIDLGQIINRRTGDLTIASAGIQKGFEHYKASCDIRRLQLACG